MLASRAVAVLSVYHTSDEVGPTPVGGSLALASYSGDFEACVPYGAQASNPPVGRAKMTSISNFGVDDVVDVVTKPVLTMLFTPLRAMLNGEALPRIVGVSPNKESDY